MRQVAILGLGKFGSTLAKELTERGAYVIALDEKKERVESIKELVTYAVTANSTDENALRAIGIQNVDIAVVCVGENIEANLLTTLLLKKMGVKKVWSRAISPLQQEILKTLEVDYIMNLEEEMGEIIAASLVLRSISKSIPLGKGCSIVEIETPKHFVGKTIQAINPRVSFMVNIIAVKKRKPAINKLGERVFEEYINHIPAPDQLLEAEDVLLVSGDNKDIEKFSGLK